MTVPGADRTLTALRIAVVGGVPASLGGGGLEVQVRETVAALQRAGHEVFSVAGEPQPRPFDVLHAFSAEPDVCQWLSGTGAATPRR